MGWFLPGKNETKKKSGKGKGKSKSKSKRGKSSKGKSGGDGVDRATVLAWAKGLGVAAVVIAAGFGWHHGQAWLQDYVAERRAEPIVDLRMVELVDQPTWMDWSWANDVRQRVAGVVEADPFDQQSLQAAADSVAASPWVERVRRVERLDHGRIAVHAEYRRPVAVVRTGQAYYLVDREMRRLPGVYRFDQLAQPCPPVIEGVASAAPQVGQTWPGGDVRAGARLAVLLASDARLIEEVRAVDVSNYRGRANPQIPHLAVKLYDRPGFVLWGRAPGSEDFGERRAEEKVERLVSLLDRPGLFDDGQAIDISFQQTYKRPAGSFSSVR